MFVMRECMACKTSFLVKSSQLAHGRGKYCSHACAASVAAKNRNQYGDKNPNWKGDGDPRIKFSNSKATYRARHREKHLAHKAIQTAVARGKIKRGCCEICGAPDTHAHHIDYSKRLDIKWLCHKHHMDEHYR